MLNKNHLSRYTQKEIDELNNQKNSKYCLVIIFGIVYNLNKFAPHHPGGERLIMQAAGEILDDIVVDSNHRFTTTQVQERMAKYKFGLFEHNTIPNSHPITSCNETNNNSNPLQVGLSWLFG